jgi:hypothetical protein
MSKVIRFKVEDKNVTLLISNNGTVSQLRNGDITYSGSPPMWASIKEWAPDNKALMAAYFELYPHNISVDIRNLLCFMINNDLEPEKHIGNLTVKIGSEEHPIHISSNGKLSFLRKRGDSLAALGISANQIWLKDRNNNLISFDDNESNADVCVDTLESKIDSDGTIYWLHPIYRWFSEKDGDILPDWLKKMAEKNPLFRGWKSIELVTQDVASDILPLPFLKNTSCDNIPCCSHDGLKHNTFSGSENTVSTNTHSNLYYGTYMPTQPPTECVDASLCMYPRNFTYFNRDFYTDPRNEYHKSHIYTMEK